MNQKDYFKQVFNVTKRKLYKQDIRAEEIEKFSKVFNVMLGGDDMFRQLYLLMQVKKLENFGKYLLYILKKLDDKVINSENIYGNIVSDSEFIEKEILEYLGIELNAEMHEAEEIIEVKPRPIKEKLYIVDNKDEDEEEDKTDETIKEFYRDMERSDEEDEGELEIELIKEDDDEDHKTINLELLDIERNPNPSEIDMVFELPSSVAENIIHDSFIEHVDEDTDAVDRKEDSPEASTEFEKAEADMIGDMIENIIEENAAIIEDPNSDIYNDGNAEVSIPEEESKVEENSAEANREVAAQSSEPPKEEDVPEAASEETNETDENVLTELPKGIDEIFEEKTAEDIAASLSEKTEESTEFIENQLENDISENVNKPAEIEATADITDEAQEDIKENISEEPQQSLEFDIPIEREIPDKKESVQEPAQEETFIEREQAPEEANQEFVEYERTVMRVNSELHADFEMMMQYAKKLNKDYAQRDAKIKDIISKTYLLEQLSKDLSFEVITNIYQTFRYSFEKISDGKYDISEDTLQLFIRGLELVISLIKEDSISGYDKQIKDLDKIRKALLIENKKKSEAAQKKKEEEMIESSIQNKYPDHYQREIIFKIRKKILDTEKVFNSINEVDSEFVLYDRLRLLGDNLNNFKELVQNAKEINLEKLAKLSEGGYILIKYIQNYRIDPSSEEMKEIFGYITYNLKLLVLDKPAEDIDVFISYLYDPVKIFTEQEKQKNDNLNKQDE